MKLSNNESHKVIKEIIEIIKINEDKKGKMKI